MHLSESTGSMASIDTHKMLVSPESAETTIHHLLPSTDQSNATVVLTSSTNNNQHPSDIGAVHQSTPSPSPHNMLSYLSRWIDFPKVDSFMDVFSLGCSTALVVGSMVPYIPQYLKIKQTSSSEGFSTYVCLTLLIANILRIMFWFGHPFEMPLLIQSYVMIVGMILMMELCIRTRERNSPYTISAISGLQPTENQRRRFLNGSSTTNTFWDWDDYFSYVKFLSLFTFIVSSLTYLLLDYYIYVETLGFVAVFAESMLGVPQLLRNHSKKSTQGMSVEMVVMWLSGDLFKTLYSILKHAPVQFYVCGTVQIIVDILILWQVFWYKRPVVLYRKLPKST